MNAQVLCSAASTARQLFDHVAGMLGQCEQDDGGEPDGDAVLGLNAHDTRLAGSLAVVVAYARNLLLSKAFGSEKVEQRRQGKTDYENFMIILGHMHRSEEQTVGRDWKELWPTLQNRHKMRGIVLTVCEGVAKGKQVVLEKVERAGAVAV
jgi:hypothetical protein